MDDDGARQSGYLIRGRVQGVGFRWWTRQAARELGLSGAVRNLRDGSVEIHVRGPEDRVSAFQRRLGQGPPGARVESVSETESALEISDGTFRIDH